MHVAAIVSKHAPGLGGLIICRHIFEPPSSEVENVG